MRTLSFILYYLCTCISILAQVTYQHNAFRPEDYIIKQQVSFHDPGPGGVNILWDLSNPELLNPEYKLSYHDISAMSSKNSLAEYDSLLYEVALNKELLIKWEQYTSYYYRLTFDSLFLLGYDNAVVRMRYLQPIKLLSYPFNYQQSIIHNFTASGIYSSRDSILLEGKVEIQADAYGRILLPNGEILSDVIRIKNTQQSSEIDTISSGEESNYHLETITHAWYSRGYRYPIYETIQTFHLKGDVKKEVFSTAFFYPPQEHSYLIDDSINQLLLDSIYNTQFRTRERNMHFTDTNSYGLPKKCEFVYKVHPNPTLIHLNVEYKINNETHIEISLNDIEGRILEVFLNENLQPGSYQQQFFCGNYPAGTYLLTIKSDTEIINEKITIK